MKKLCKYIIGLSLGVMAFGGKVEAAEIRNANAVLYTNTSTVIYAGADFAEKVILPDVEEGLPVKVTGITDNGFFQVDIAGTYYIPEYGLDVTADIAGSIQTDSKNELSEQVIENTNEYRAYINEVIQLVNEEREKIGLNALECDDNLVYAATRRSVENAYYDSFSHTRPNGTSCLTIFSEYNRQNYHRAGENIAMRQKTPKEVVQDWMESPGHRMNILGRFTRIGVGIAKDDKGQLYWTQLFYA